MKRLLLIFMTLALSAPACGGVKDGSPDADHRDGGGTDGDEADAGATGACVLGTSQLGNCNL